MSDYRKYTISDDAKVEVRNGRLIMAIKQIRQDTNCSLIVAKNMAELYRDTGCNVFEYSTNLNDTYVRRLDLLCDSPVTVNVPVTNKRMADIILALKDAGFSRSDIEKIFKNTLDDFFTVR